MSEENVEIVRKLAEQFNLFMRGELSSKALAEPFDLGIEVHWQDERTYPDTPQHLRGARALIAFSEQYRDGWANLTQESLELIEAPGGRVLALIRRVPARPQPLSTPLLRRPPRPHGLADHAA